MEKDTKKNIMKKVKGKMERNAEDDMKKGYGDWGKMNMPLGGWETPR